MPVIARFALACLFATALSGAGLAAPRVVATIKPIHSIAASVMAGVAEPELLLNAAVSEHTAQLTPSQVEAMQNADLIVAVGENLEAFLHKALENPEIGQKKIFEAAEVPGVKALPARDGGLWEPHSDGDAEQGHDHDHGGNDPHIWMDPENAKAVALALATTLGDLDSANAAKYQENAAKFAASLDALSAEVTRQIAPVQDKRYIVFHDAYQYFETRFGMNPAGSVTINPEVTPGAKRLKEIRDRITETNAVCVFAEPQFEPKYVETVTEGTTAKTAVLDGLGAQQPEGPGAYAAMMRGFVNALTTCLKG